MDLLVTAAIAAIAGIGVGILVSGRLDRPNKRTRILEADLDAARTELTTYRQSVLAQFTQTAEKFRDLNDSYVALHRQLAESAHRLCGTEVGRLLEAPRTEDQLAAGESSTGDDATDAGTETVRRGAIPWSDSLAGSTASTAAAGSETATGPTASTAGAGSADTGSDFDESGTEQIDAVDSGVDGAQDGVPDSGGVLANSSASDPSEGEGPGSSSGAEESGTAPEDGAAADEAGRDSAASGEDGDRPMTRTEAFRAARAEHAATTAGGETGVDEPRSGNASESKNLGKAHEEANGEADRATG